MNGNPSTKLFLTEVKPSNSTFKHVAYIALPMPLASFKYPFIWLSWTILRMHFISNADARNWSNFFLPHLLILWKQTKNKLKLKCLQDTSKFFDLFAKFTIVAPGNPECLNLVFSLKQCYYNLHLSIIARPLCQVLHYICILN